jgi:hypothetical protein
MRRYVVLAALLLGGAVACGDDPDAGPDPTSSGPDSSDATPSPSGPVAAKPVRAPLGWQATGVGVDDTVVRGREWTAVTDRDGRRTVLTREDDEVRVDAGRQRRILEVLMSDTHAVVVAQDDLEERPLALTVVDLADGATSTVDDPAPAPNGSTSLTGSTLHYASYDASRAYCLATYDLVESSGSTGYCAHPRSGWTGVRGSPAGTTLTSFDDTEPACRTPLDIADDGSGTPVEGVPACKAWDVLAVPGGHVWSVVRDEQVIEEGELTASVDGRVHLLGPGTTGTLTWCGDSAYFVRDPQRDVGKARLVRWTPERTLEIVYETRGRGAAFLGEPRCAGSVLTISAFAEAGDEQVWATVPG